MLHHALQYYLRCYWQINCTWSCSQPWPGKQVSVLSALTRRVYSQLWTGVCSQPWPSKHVLNPDQQEGSQFWPGEHVFSFCLCSYFPISPHEFLVNSRHLMNVNFQSSPNLTGMLLLFCNVIASFFPLILSNLHVTLTRHHKKSFLLERAINGQKAKNKWCWSVHYQLVQRNP